MGVSLLSQNHRKAQTFSIHSWNVHQITSLTSHPLLPLPTIESPTSWSLYNTIHLPLLLHYLFLSQWLLFLRLPHLRGRILEPTVGEGVLWTLVFGSPLSCSSLSARSLQLLWFCLCLNMSILELPCLLGLLVMRVDALRRSRFCTGDIIILIRLLSRSLVSIVLILTLQRGRLRSLYPGLLKEMVDRVATRLLVVDTMRS